MSAGRPRRSLRNRHLLERMCLLDVTFPVLWLVFRSSSVSAMALAVLGRCPTPAAVAAALVGDLERLIVIEAHAPKLKRIVPELHALAATSVGLHEEIDELVAAERWLTEQTWAADEELRRLDTELERALQA